MPSPFSYRKVSLGVAAGFIGGICGLIFAFVVGVLAIAVTLKEFFATLLAAGTVLPLMLIFVFFLPDMILGIVTGLLLGLASNFTDRLGLTGAMIGLVCAEIVFSLLIPVIVTPHPGDFVEIIANRYLSGAYGVFLGVATSRVFRWMT